MGKSRLNGLCAVIGYGQVAKKHSRGCCVHLRRDHLPLAAHDSDIGTLAAVLRGAGAASSVGASVRVSPVACVAVACGVVTSPIPAVPLAGGSAAPSVATTSRASFSASGTPMGAALPAAATSGATSSSGVPLGASVTTTTAASPVAGRPPAVVAPVGGEHTALLVKLVLVQSASKSVRRAVVVRDPTARHQTHDNFSSPLCLPRVMPHQHPYPVDGQEALARQLQEESAGTGDHG